MKKAGVLSFLILSIFTSNAQVGFRASQTNNDCFGDSSGTITVDSLSGCYAPLTFQLDTDTFTFDNLKNEGYNGLNQATAAGFQQATGVAAGSTSIGDVYVVGGYFEDSDSVLIDTIMVYETAGAEGSGWVAAFDANTSGVLWAHEVSAGSGGYCAAYNAEIVGDKAFFVGYMLGNTSFGGTIITNSNGYQGYVMKVDIPTGNVEDVVQIGNAGLDEVTNIRAGEDDRLYLSGDFTGSIQLAGNTYSSSSSYDMFLTCFDTSLTTNYWAITAGGSSFDVANDIVPYFNNGVVEYVYTTGYYYGTANFGTNSLPASTTNSQDIFIAKADVNGNWIWAKSANGPSNADNAPSIDLNPDGDKLYACGYFGNTINYDGQSLVSAGNRDGFIVYLDTSGSLLDAYHLAGLGRDGIYDIDCVGDDYLVFAAEFSLSFDFADSTFVPNGTLGTDAFAGKIGPDLNEIWGKNFGGTSNVTEAFNSIAAGSNARLHCAGAFAGDASAFQAGLIAQGTDGIVTNETITGVVDTIMTFTGLPAGEYTMNLTDSLGNMLLDTLDITQPDEIATAGTVIDASSPTAADGSIDLTAMGGTMPYMYSWSNADTTEDISGLAAGWYTVTVTDSLGCSGVDSFFVDSAEVILEMMVTGTVSDKTCETDNNGAIDISVVNGIPPYSFVWSSGETTEDISGLSPGTYMVTVTDSNSETANETFTVSDNPIHPDPTVGPISGAAIVDWFSPFQYTVPATQGSLFEWSAFDGVVVTTAGNTASIEWQAGPDGIVYVSETDINGCSGMDSLLVEIKPNGIAEQGETIIKMYPNPVSDVLTIQLNENLIGAQINLFDINGRRVANAKSVGSTATINVSELEAGVYTVNIEKGETVITQSVVVQ